MKLACTLHKQGGCGQITLTWHMLYQIGHVAWQTLSQVTLQATCHAIKHPRLTRRSGISRCTLRVPGSQKSLNDAIQRRQRDAIQAIATRATCLIPRVINYHFKSAPMGKVSYPSYNMSLHTSIHASIFCIHGLETFWLNFRSGHF